MRERQPTTSSRMKLGGHARSPKRSIAPTALDRIYAIATRLETRYRAPLLGNKKNPVDELIFILLSSQTQEDNYLRTFRAMKARFGPWRRAAEAGRREILRVIRSGGLGRKKAAQISSILRRIGEEFGRVSLRPLARLSDRRAEEYLTSLPGVGLKTARCVMMYSLGRQVFPVDRHVFRISRRLGLIDQGAGLTPATSDALQELVPRGLMNHLHRNMVAHGRAICLDRDPRCHRCPLLDLCPTGIAKVGAAA